MIYLLLFDGISIYHHNKPVKKVITKEGKSIMQAALVTNLGKKRDINIS